MLTTSGPTILQDGTAYISVNGRVYLADLRNKDNWASTLRVRNDGTEQRTIRIYYFNANGTRVDNGIPHSCILNPNQQCEKLSKIPAGNVGSAYVDGGEAVSVMVENYNGAMRYAYTGQTAPVTPEHLPQTIQNLNGIWSTTIHALNTGANRSDLTTNFYSGDGSTPPTGSPAVLPNIASNGSGDVNQASLPNGYYGTGRIAANQSVAAVTQVWESNNTSRRLGYSSLPVADSTIFLPFVMTRLGNDWGAAVWIQNTYGYQTTITVDFYNDTQSAPIQTVNLPTVNGLGLATLNLRIDNYGLGLGWFGSARVRSNTSAPLAVVVNQFNDGSNLGASYEGVPASSGTTKAVLPYVVRRYNTCYISNYTVRNLGSTDATIVIRYYRQDGTVALNDSGAMSGSTSDETVKSHTVYNLYYTTPPTNHTFPTNGFRGSVVITSTNGQPIAATSNMLYYASSSCTSRDDTISYTGVNR